MNSILIIDDDALIRTSVGAVLQSAGYKTTSASDGPTGIKIAREIHPDLILCDIDMPGMSGFETEKVLSSDPQTNSLPIVFLTGSTKAMEGQLGRDLSGDEFVEKPFSFSKLLAVVSARLLK
jgi:CheY-like chemotaxis protein